MAKNNNKTFKMDFVDKMLKKKEKYLVFYDTDGILKGGLWILFNKKANSVLKILPNPEIGDILLAIDKNEQPAKTFEDMEEYIPDPSHIVGIAIISTKEPENIGKYIENYFIRIKNTMSNWDKNSYNYNVYSYLLDKISNCDILIRKDLTMQHDGIQEQMVS